MKITVRSIWLGCVCAVALLGCTGSDVTKTNIIGGTGSEAGGTTADPSSTDQGDGGASGGDSSSAGTTGGDVATGGSSDTGGTAATGGNSDTGGTVATGGSSDTGGTTAAPATATFKCSNLPMYVTASAVPKPAGTAGNLKVVNWAGYQGAISFTFDDETSSQIAAYSTLNGLGVHYTFYVVSSWFSATSVAVITQAVKDGHEIGNHTATHGGTISQADIQTCTDYIKSNFGVTPYAFASPNGNTTYAQWTRTMFLTDRGVADGLIMPNGSANQYQLPCYLPATGATAAGEINAKLLQAQTGAGWKVVLVHGFASDAYHPINLNEFVTAVQYAKSLRNVWIDTVSNVGSYWVGQKLLTAATPTTSGSDKTYTWTWPSIYPPNSCVRVTVDGGTLKQGGQELTWNPSGYYEVSLDAGSLTLSP